MYDTQYNRKIAKEIDRLNKEYIKHSKDLEGGHKKGQKKYNKQAHICHHCQGSGISGSGISGSGVSGSGISGSGMFNIGVPGLGGLGVGWGKGEKKMEGKGGIGLNLPFGGFNVGWGKPEPKKIKGKGSVGLNLPFGGFNVGWGKDKKGGESKKRGNPNISKRAEIVKKVMKEQGLGMIEASKYVKANNLY